ncbi:8-oxoguanine deaminase [Vibrio aerogenes CECT 7868]|uniref:8-oxoguanine deaminase n=1 Tax=Vibrio aerogenes CECT 7868 TaxID=1216006 RepID=A0A1M5YF50_9VIBR|nr:formimidoylglutamate deiminase [Vibrio aerogenes]SHI10680.1 8-oxoguanine deaminase [Vibrio aerogenes CECT 7868]
MKRFLCTQALLHDGWQSDVLIEVDMQGVITSVQQGVRDVPEQTERLSGLVIPSMVNLHSHAFQRAMAGLAEVAGDPQDSFWTWREQMYHLVSHLSPEQVGVIAAYLYIDMLKGGYTQVAEFNYLHHDKDGKPYQQDEMALQLINAAGEAGIGQTLLPVLYTYSGFGGQAAQPLQKRFIQDTEAYLSRFAELQKQIKEKALHHAGICFHSLRAVSPVQMNQVLSHAPVDLPVHIHIAEQMKEVNDCIAWSGQRPVEWLYDHAEVDSRWCLVHATHLTGQEVTSIADSRAVVGICTTTEANLGDGIFPAADYIQQGGRWGVGSDSHVSLSAVEELRWLEYGQRLRDQRRNRLVDPVTGSVGDMLWQQAAAGGSQACGVNLGTLAVGKRADWLVLENNEWLENLPSSLWLNRWLFGGQSQMIRDVYVAGKRVIEQGHHPLEFAVRQQFSQVMKALKIS